MIDIIKLLKENERLSAYRVSEKATSSYELFFVHKKLETVRSTDTSSTRVTVYVKHGEFLGDSTFEILQSDDEKSANGKIDAAINRAALVFNRPYELPPCGTLDETLPSNLYDFDEKTLGAEIAKAVFAADNEENCSLNAVEIFIYKEKTHVLNSNCVDKTQNNARVMIEAIPTFTDEKLSVELYEDYRFTEFNPEKLTAEIARKIKEVKDRALATKPQTPLKTNVLLRNSEIYGVLRELLMSLNYSAVYAHANPFKIGDDIQQNGDGDKLTITMKAMIAGSENSAFFDEDGSSLKDVKVIDGGIVKNYYGTYRFGQYLGVDEPSGNLRLAKLEKGSLKREELNKEPYIECVSLSGIQLDIFNDYIGGEIRLAYLCDKNTKTPITSITMSAKLSDVLKTVKLSDNEDVFVGYEGPDLMLLKDVNIL